MNNQKIVTNFSINRLSNNGFEIVLPITSLNPTIFQTFTFKGMPNGIRLDFKGDVEDKHLLLEGIPHNVLKRLFKSKMIRVREKPILEITQGAVMIFVNEAYLVAIS